MTEQELRDKIIKALKHGGDMFHEYFMRSLNDAKESGKTHFGSKDCDKSMYDFFTDALIEDGIGDVKVLERALDLCEIAYLLALNGKQNEGISQEAIISDLGIHGFFMEKAEKELQEKRNEEVRKFHI